jgi:hypothetical protein
MSFGDLPVDADAVEAELRTEGYDYDRDSDHNLEGERPSFAEATEDKPREQ